MANPYVNKVQTADGTTIIDISDTTAVASDVASGKYFYNATGQKVQGSASGGAISVIDTTDPVAGGTIRTITAVDISDTTAVAEDVAQGKYFYTADGTKVEGTAIMGSAKLRRIRTIVVPEALPSGGVDSSGVNWVECSGGGFNFGFNTDENGDSFNLTKVAITYACYTADSVSRRGQVRVSNNANPAAIGKLSGIDYDKSFNNVGAWFTEYLGKAWFACGATNGLNSYHWDSEWYRNTEYQSFQAFSMMAVYPASVGFVSGSTFEIWGRD